MRCQASVAVTVSLNCQGPRSGTRCESTSPTLVPPPRSPPSSYRLPRYLSMRRGGLSSRLCASLVFESFDRAKRSMVLDASLLYFVLYRDWRIFVLLLSSDTTRKYDNSAVYTKIGKNLCALEGRNAVCVAINYNVICNTCQSVKDILSNGIRDAPPSINVTDHRFLIETYD